MERSCTLWYTHTLVSLKLLNDDHGRVSKRGEDQTLCLVRVFDALQGCLQPGKLRNDLEIKFVSDCMVGRTPCAQERWTIAWVYLFSSIKPIWCLHNLCIPVIYLATKDYTIILLINIDNTGAICPGCRIWTSFIKYFFNKSVIIVNIGVPKQFTSTS